MTTIAFDGRYVAADTLMTFGNGSINQLPARKLVVRDGHVFASTGRIINGLRDRFVDWWFTPAITGAERSTMPDHGAADAATVGSLIIVLPDLRCGCVSYTQPDFLETGPISAWGSGEDYALGAIEAGANAMEAVLIAMRHDINTGGEVEFVDTHDLDSGVQRYCQPADVRMIHGSASPLMASLRAARAEWRACTCRAAEDIPPTLPDHVLISKPHAPAKSDTGANLWADACTGRLVLGNGCGQCLRCNREWWAISKQSHEAVAPGVIRLTQDEVKASLARAPVVQPERVGLAKAFDEFWNDEERPTRHAFKQHIGLGLLDRTDDKAHAFSFVADVPVYGQTLTEPPRSSVISREEARATEAGSALQAHVDAWNTASAVGDEHRMKGLDIELRSLNFPPDVQVAIVGSAGSPKRKVIINAPAQSQA
jgi:hypothetical protein